MSSIGVDEFGQLADGRGVDCYTLANDNGLSLTLCEFGARIHALQVPDRRGDSADVVLGCDSLADYEADRCYFGATVGRYANRIAGGRFALGNTQYAVTTNEHIDGCRQHLHGGKVGLDRQLWSGAIDRDTDGGHRGSGHRGSGRRGVSFYLTSPDGAEGYPGTLKLRVRYSLDDHDALHIEYFARSDKPTVINLTNHSYFNLAGHDSGSVADHRLRVFASRYTPVDVCLIPTGDIADVDGSVYDLRDAARLGDRLADPALAANGGYDVNYVLDADNPRMTLAAILDEAGSGRRMAVLTSQPGMQLYTGNALDIDAAKDGVRYAAHAGLCLETQHFPDAPNQPHFPTTRLPAEQLFYARTILRFSTFDPATTGEPESS